MHQAMVVTKVGHIERMFARSRVDVNHPCAQEQQRTVPTVRTAQANRAAQAANRTASPKPARPARAAAEASPNQGVHGQAGRGGRHGPRRQLAIRRPGHPSDQRRPSQQDRRREGPGSPGNPARSSSSASAANAPATRAAGCGRDHSRNPAARPAPRPTNPGTKDQAVGSGSAATSTHPFGNQQHEPAREEQGQPDGDPTGSAWSWVAPSRHRLLALLHLPCGMVIPAPPRLPSRTPAVWCRTGWRQV
jgi:hypothetical protein